MVVASAGDPAMPDCWNSRAFAAVAVDGGTALCRSIAQLHAQAEALEPSHAQLLASEARFRSLITDLRDLVVWRGLHGGHGPSRREAALRESEARWRDLAEAAPVAILTLTGWRCSYANPRAARLLGAPATADLAGRTLVNLLGAAGARRLRRALRAGTGAEAREIFCTRLDGGGVAVELLAATLTEGDPPVVQLVLVDLSARKRAAATRHLAERDSLTGLPARRFFLDRFAAAVAGRRRGGRVPILMLLDLDGLKQVNDTYGHAAGDELLRLVADRVRGVVREGDVLARLGGDEFALLQTAVPSARAMSRGAARIVDAMAHPFTFDRQEIRVGISVGVAACPEADASTDILLHRAEKALHRAKSLGRSRFCLFEPDLDEACEARRRLERDLQQAVHDREFHLAYQPQLDLATRRVCGVEALLRWEHAARGTVAPVDFIPVAESTGLIRALGSWALDQACAQARRWREDGLVLQVAVNVSAVQLQRPDFAEIVTGALRRHALPPGQLCLELTESLLIDPQLDGIGAMLERVAGEGVRIAIDDFGTGYSSLLNLKRLPVHHVKIDRSFVQEVGQDADSEAIVRATVSLAHSLGKQVVAEGVETEAQHRFLAALGCESAQGYVYARPGRAEALRTYLAVHAG